VDLDCAGTADDVACSDGEPSGQGEPALELNLEVAMGKVEVQR
jgi:hypothetical protein